jgi:hypothetical protein
MIKRVGFITTSFEMLDYHTEEISKAFSKIEFVPLHTESLYHIAQVKQSGYSPEFREIEEGEIAPEYSFVIKKDEDGEILEIKVEEIK